MKDIREVLAQKDSEREKLEWEIEALRCAAEILDDSPKDRTPEPIYYDVDSVKTRIAERAAEAACTAPEPLPAEPNHAVELQKQHISDLRVLIDKSEARETILLDLVKMVMEERYFRPNITRPPSLNKTSSAIPPEHLSDVATFDEAADMAQSKEEGDLQTKLQSEFDSILTEHNEAHQEG